MHNIQQESNKPPSWFMGFILLLLLFPLPFGGNRAWASDLFALFTSITLIAMLWHQHVVPPTTITGIPPRKRILFAVVGISCVALWSFLQTMPWTPNSWHHPMWSVVSEHLGTSKSTISLNTSLFFESFIRFLSYVGCFLLAFFGCRQTRSAARLVKWLAYGAGAYALYGLLMHSSGAEMILWYDKWAYQGFLTSTFVNKNSYAAYAGLGLLCCLGQLYTHIRRLRVKDKILAKRTKFLAFLASMELRDMAAFLPTLLVLGALALTGSRAGIFSTIIGVSAFTLSFALHKRIKTNHWLWIASGLGALFILFVALGGDALLHRLGETKINDDAALRLTAYDLSSTAITDNPWLGYGLGTFEEAFRIYRDDRLPLWYHHAHNDYLEMMMDLGIPMAFLLFTSIAALISCCISGLTTRKRKGLYPALAIGASALIATHAFVDFSMHIPAIAATYAALLGLGVSQCWSSQKVDLNGS